MTKRTLPLLLLAAMLAAACATTASAGDGPSGSVSTSVPPASGPPPAQKPKIVPVKPGAALAQVNGPVIETERLILRTWRADDTERGQWNA